MLARLSLTTVLCVAGARALPVRTAPLPTHRTIAPGVSMPVVNLGTCCGSQPKVGLASWLAAGGRGIDTAYDYGKLVPGGRESDIKAVLAKSSIPRSDLFITTKIPAGYGIAIGSCSGGAKEAMTQVLENLKELGMKQVDLVLLHHPCHTDAQNQGLWAGLEQALAQGLTRSIGVSNYKQKDLEGLMAKATVKPAVNQCEMSVASYDAATIAYSQSQNITYQAFNAMKGCPFTSAPMAKITAAHSVGASQVCLRWVLQRGAVMAVGTGANATTAAEYAKEDLDLFGFELTEAEMDVLNNIHLEL